MQSSALKRTRRLLRTTSRRLAPEDAALSLGLAEASVSRSLADTLGVRPDRARSGPVLGRSHLGGSARGKRDDVSSRVPLDAAGPAPCFWRSAGRSGLRPRHLLRRDCGNWLGLQRRFPDRFRGSSEWRASGEASGICSRGRGAVARALDAALPAGRSWSSWRVLSPVCAAPMGSVVAALGVVWA